MNLVALLTGTLVISTLIYVVGAMAASGKASPRNHLLRATSGSYRGEPIPPTWLCEHTWEITQRVAAPYFRRQAFTLVASCFLVALLTMFGMPATMGYPVIVLLFLLTSYITFSIGGGQRGHDLSALRCEHFDGRAVAAGPLPSRSQRFSSGRVRTA